MKYFFTFAGFDCCVQYEHSVCNCSYSCKFVKEYYDDSKEISDEDMRQMNSAWAEKRRQSLIEKEKFREEEAEAQKEMWRRVQEQLAQED